MDCVYIFWINQRLPKDVVALTSQRLAAVGDMLHCFSLHPAESVGWIPIKQAYNCFHTFLDQSQTRQHPPHINLTSCFGNNSWHFLYSRFYLSFNCDATVVRFVSTCCPFTSICRVTEQSTAKVRVSEILLATEKLWQRILVVDFVRWKTNLFNKWFITSTNPPLPNLRF